MQIESYVYFPFLQETDYMPKHNFSYGFEIRAYLESLAARYGLDKNAMFRTKILSAEWDDVSKHWIVTMSKRIANDPPRTFKVRARFLSHFAGAHVHQKLPSIPGIASYKGDQFHVSIPAIKNWSQPGLQIYSHILSSDRPLELRYHWRQPREPGTG